MNRILATLERWRGLWFALSVVMLIDGIKSKDLMTVGIGAGNIGWNAGGWAYQEPETKVKSPNSNSQSDP